MKEVQMYGQDAAGQVPIAPKTTIDAVDGLNAALNGKADGEHSHDVDEIVGLVEALDGKSSTGHTHAQGDVTGLTEAIANVVNQAVVAAKLAVYPVGAIYVSTVSQSPAGLFGGTWEQITDRFLLAAGYSYVAGSTGGAATVTLTESQMPAHAHAPSANGEQVMTVSSTGYDGIVPTTGGSMWVHWSGNWATTTKGGGQAHSNMPPYLVVYMWKRIA